MSMRIFILFFGAILGVAVWGVACNEPNTTTANVEQGPMDYTTAAYSFLTDSMPGIADTLTVGFRDLNFYTSKDHFCIVGIVDNQSRFWRKIWLQAQLADSSGTALAFNGDTTLIIRAFSNAVPPRGATAFFAAVPLSQLSGTPVSCRVAGAGAIERPPGPILIAMTTAGSGVYSLDSTVASGFRESAYNLNAQINNPLNERAYHPRIVLLMYANDNRLYYAQLINPELRSFLVKQDNQGPMSPSEKRNIYYQIAYDMIPEPLQNLRISRVEVQAFDMR